MCAPPDGKSGDVLDDESGAAERQTLFNNMNEVICVGTCVDSCDERNTM